MGSLTYPPKQRYQLLYVSPTYAADGIDSCTSGHFAIPSVVECKRSAARPFTLDPLRQQKPSRQRGSFHLGEIGRGCLPSGP